jgi:hypothetical protein
MSSILVLFCSFALAEHQQQLDFPTEIPNKNQIGSRFFRLDYDLLKDERFRFQVLLPNGWKVIDFRERRVIPNQSPQEIAVFRADPRGGEFGEIMVAVTKVTTDTIPSQWLKNRIKSPEAKIENQQIVPSQSGETWDVLYSFKKNALKLVSRCYAFRIGELLYMIEATSDETVYADRAEFFVTFMALR